MIDDFPLSKMDALANDLVVVVLSQLDKSRDAFVFSVEKNLLILSMTFSLIKLLTFDFSTRGSRAKLTLLIHLSFLTSYSTSRRKI